MRSRFTLLIAAAIVFAPGWSGRAAPSHEPGRELAARVLAPTVDEGALQTAPSVKKQLRTGRGEVDPLDVATPIVDSLLLAVALTVLGFLVAGIKRSISARHIRFSPSRAPPNLQPA